MTLSRCLLLILPFVAMTATASPRIEKLTCLTESRLSEVRKDPNGAIARVFDSCSAELAIKTAELELTDKQKKLAFASILAYAMAPYGESRSISLKDLLADKVLDCDNYALLTGHFATLLIGREAHVKFAGFDGGAVGNHAQLFAAQKNDRLMLDPTVGLIAKIGFDDLLMGKAIPEGKIRIFRQREDKSMDAFADKVWTAVSKGEYRPSDLLYYFPSMDQYLKFSKEIQPLWRKDVESLLRRFPTPGAEALRKNLSKQSAKKNLKKN